MKLNTMYKPINNKITSTAIIAVLFGLVLLTGCSEEDKQQPPIFTQLNKIVPNEYACKDALLKVGNDLILQKKHFLSLQQSNAGQLHVIGVVNYNDRPAHVSFNANNNANKACVINYNLSYQLDTPCMAAREEVFKKFNQIGTLGDKTRFFEHKRNANKTAFLTNINQDLQCLVDVNVTEVVTSNP